MDISTNVAYLAALSMAAERLTEMIRGLPLFAFPRNPSMTVQQEGTRAAKVSTLAVFTGVITAVIACLIHVLPVAQNWPEVVIFGVLAGAGSGFWNAVLAYLVGLKNALPKVPAQAITEMKAMGASAGR